MTSAHPGAEMDDLDLDAVRDPRRPAAKVGERGLLLATAALFSLVTAVGLILWSGAIPAP